MPEWEHRPGLVDGQRATPPAGRTVKSSITRTVGNLPIRVPAMDWDLVSTGQKRMFRTYTQKATDRSRPVVPPETEVPRPCLLYAARHGAHKGFRMVPGVLLSHRQEPLGTISQEDLAAEGFEYLPAFRFYWKRRYRSIGWRPWEMVSVLEVRPMQFEVEGHDFDEFGWWAMEEMYGEWTS